MRILNAQQKSSEEYDVYIFNHIPKCAGSSLEVALKSQFGNNYYYIRKIRCLEIFKIPHYFSSDICLSGHLGTGVEALFTTARAIYTFTLLRHPFFSPTTE